jgi:hypothetical protein
VPSGLADTVLPLEPISSVLRVLSSSSGTKLLDEAVSMSRLENVESLLMLLDLDVALTLDDCEEPKLEVAVIMMGTQFVSLCWNCRWDRADEIMSPPNTRVQSDTGLSVGNVNDEFGNQECIEKEKPGAKISTLHSIIEDVQRFSNPSVPVSGRDTTTFIISPDFKAPRVLRENSSNL